MEMLIDTRDVPDAVKRRVVNHYDEEGNVVGTHEVDATYCVAIIRDPDNKKFYVNADDRPIETICGHERLEENEQITAWAYKMNPNTGEVKWAWPHRGHGVYRSVLQKMEEDEVLVPALKVKD
jgi:hypothetical protein